MIGDPSAFDFASSVPVVELDEEPACEKCRTRISGEAYPDDDGWYCESCMRERVFTFEAEARTYAEEHCRITKPLPWYNPLDEYRCTPEEYEMGDRESCTPNAHACHCRHNCTNYDELIKPLDRGSVRDQVFYSAIRDRIEELLEEAMLNGE